MSLPGCILAVKCLAEKQISSACWANTLHLRFIVLHSDHAKVSGVQGSHEYKCSVFWLESGQCHWSWTYIRVTKQEKNSKQKTLQYLYVWHYENRKQGFSMQRHGQSCWAEEESATVTPHLRCLMDLTPGLTDRKMFISWFTERVGKNTTWLTDWLNV